jgi:hypothetical protein
VTFAETAPHSLTRRRWLILAILAALAIVPYLPTLTQPFIEDDYPNIQLANTFAAQGWAEMLANPIFRLRATTHLLFHVLYRIFDMDARAFYAAMILLHVLNTGLVFALGSWRVIGYGVSIWAAAFFAIYEGHQEAVMWISGSTEPLLVLFGLLSFLCWLRFLERPSVIWYAGSFAAFCLALASKESAVIWVALLALPVAFDLKRCRKVLWLLPHAALSAIAAWSIFRTRTFSFRFSDGSFSLHAPFWITLPVNYGHLFWFWGLASVIAIVVWKPANTERIVTAGLAWVGLALIPYSFLTYSQRIPSRQMHLASIGLAIIVGFALSELLERYWTTRRAIVVAVCVAMLVHNVAYLWTKKRAQFLERAAPTEQLLDLATVTPGPIYVKCFPRPPVVADAALELMFPGRTKRDLIWNSKEASARNAVTFCYPEPRP